MPPCPSSTRSPTRSTTTTSSTPPAPSCSAPSATPYHARAADQRALELTTNPAQRTLLRQRIDWTDTAGKPDDNVTAARAALTLYEQPHGLVMNGGAWLVSAHR